MAEQRRTPEQVNFATRDLLSRTRVAIPSLRLRQHGERQVPTLSFDQPGAREAIIGPGRAAYLSVKTELHSQLLNELDRTNRLTASEESIRGFVRDFVERVLETQDLPLNDLERRRLPEDLAHETMGVGPLAPFMADPAVSDILVVGPKSVYVERFGQLERTDIQFRDADHLMRLIQRIAANLGRRIDESSPMVDARLPDGSRVNATIPPVSVDGPTLSIRRFGNVRLRSHDMVRLETCSPEMNQFLAAAVRAKKSILVSGGSGVGKSTFLATLAESILPTDRIITIEDAVELMLDQDHVVRLESRPANIEGRGRIAIRDLVINCLRMRPDRIIVGEVRGGEAIDMLQALNTGHEGGLTTIHANSPRDAIARLETMVLMSGAELPSRAIREQIASAIRLIVHLKRYEDGIRRVESITEMIGIEDGSPITQEIFRYERKGTKGRHVEGSFVATGVVPKIYDDLALLQLIQSPAIFTKAPTI